MDAEERELALQVGMIDPSTITGWVQDYRVAGAEALNSKRKTENELWTKRMPFVKLGKEIPVSKRNFF